MLEDFPEALDFCIPLKVEISHQIFHEHHGGLVRAIKLQQHECGIQTWVSADFKWNDLHRNIGSSRDLEYLGQLFPHHGTPTNGSAEGGFVDQGP